MIHNRTKIVCTLGPASQDPRILRRMIQAGADVFRLNASHGNAADHAQRISDIRRVARELKRPIGILMDLPGPKLRLGVLPDEKRVLRKGEPVLLCGPTPSRPDSLPLRDPEILKDLRPGHEIYLADGTVQLVAVKKDPSGMRCRVQVGGTVRSGSGLNLPDTELSKAVPTAADRGWIRFARKHHLDWLAVSFVQKAADIEMVRRLAGSGPEAPRLIAKIEKRGAVLQLEEIVKTADGVMVARGDLGVETPLANVPLVQKRIISFANAYGRPVITATQMLESMVEHSSPTRAEVTDVANAILDGTDAVMLSAESAIGHYPVASVATLASIATATESEFPYASAFRKLAERDWSSPHEAISFSAVRMAADCAAKAILIEPSAQTTAAAISRFRPKAAVISLCHRWDEACRQILPWGVDPLVIPRSWKQALGVIRRHLAKFHGIQHGCRVVTVQSAAKLYGAGSDLVRIVRL